VWKWFLGFLLILSILCAGGISFFTVTPKGRELLKGLGAKGKLTEVRVDTVSRGQLVKVVSAPGTLEPKTKVEISAQVSAKVIALPFRDGDEVKKGDVIVRLDADEYQANLQSAQASMLGEQARLEGLRAELINAEAEFNRARGLYETKDISKADFDLAQAAYLRARSAVDAGLQAIEVSRATIARAQKNLDLCTILAPMDGTIIKLNSEVGEQVLGTFNNAGSVIMEIADLSTMIIKAKVDEVNIVPVRAGQHARVTINGYGDRVFEGTVDLVGLKKELDRDGTGYFEAEVLVRHDKADGLRSGSNANVDIEVETFRDVLKVPSQAVVDRRIDELPREAVDHNTSVDRSKVFTRVVYKFVDGKAKAFPVTIGTSDLTHTLILAGLAENDRIIAGPYKVLVSLKDDQQVIDQEEAKKAREKPSDKPAAPKSASAPAQTPRS
jgi:HlyD family secretion protein